MTSVAKHLRPAACWLAVAALVFHIAWLPVHLLTEAHCDTGLAHAHANAQADHHGHSHDDAGAAHPHGDTDHHFTGDHGSKFLSKRQVLLDAPLLVVWQAALVTPPSAMVRELPVQPDPSPPPADFSPPSGPRAPPLA